MAVRTDQPALLYLVTDLTQSIVVSDQSPDTVSLFAFVVEFETDWVRNRTVSAPILFALVDNQPLPPFRSCVVARPLGDFHLERFPCR